MLQQMRGQTPQLSRRLSGLETLGFLRQGEGLDLLPQLLIEQDLGSERGDHRKHLVIGLTEFLGVSYLVEVGDDVPGLEKILEGLAEAQRDALKADFLRRKGSDRVHLGFGPLEGKGHVGKDSLGRELGPGDVKGLGEEWIHGLDVEVKLVGFIG